jgi:hypothetical protein
VHVGLDARRQVRRHPAAHLIGEVGRALVGHQPEGDLGVRLGRDDRLVPGAGVAAPHPVDLGGGPGTDPLQGGEAVLPGGEPGGGGTGQPGLLVEGHAGHEVALAVGERADPVVEAGQGDPPVGVVQAREQGRHGVQRVGDAAAEGAGVQVDGGPAQGDLGVGQPAHRHDGAGDVGGGHPGVADHHDVAAQPLGPLPQQGGEVRRAGLLLALDQDLDGDRRGVAAGGGQVRAHAEQVHRDVALVVDRAAGVQLRAVGALDAGGLERGVRPQLQRVDRLDVVVPVDEGHRRAVVRRGPLGVDGGGTGGLPHLHDREARAAQRGGQPLGARGDGRRVRGVGGDRRDPQPGVEVGVQVVEVRADEVAFRAAHDCRR